MRRSRRNLLMSREVSSIIVFRIIGFSKNVGSKDSELQGALLRAQDDVSCLLVA